MKKIYLTLTIVTTLVSIVSAQSLSLETGYHGTSSQIVVPGLFETVFDEANSGNGNDFHLGLIVGFNDEVAFRGGFRTWAWPFETISNGEINNEDVKAFEDGRIRYSGIYLRLDRTWNYFFLTGGFDISLTNSYTADLIIEDENGQTTLNETDNDVSVLADAFNNQVNLVLGLGPSIPIKDKFRIKAFAEIVVPFVPIYETGVTVPQIQINPNGSTSSAPDADVNLDFIPVFKYGIGLEYRLK